MSSNGVLPRDVIMMEIARLQRELARLEAALRALDGDDEAPTAPPPPPPPPRTRLDVLAAVVRDAGANGITRSEAIKRMQGVCNSTEASVSTMLTTLKAYGTIKHRGRRWYA